MNRTQLRYISIALLSLLTVRAFGQRVDSLLRSMAPYQPERVYLHLDREAYLPGDTVWMQGYVVRGLLPSPLSRTLYVDFYDGTGKALQHLAFPVQGGTAEGRTTLPATLPGNVVFMQAYTKWMLNGDSGFYFRKTVALLGRRASDNVRIRGSTVNFFPEGGGLVAGVENTVAFRSAPGGGVFLLLDSRGNVLRETRGDSSGTGRFSFTPQLGERYSLVRQDLSGISPSPLPAARVKGVVLHVEQNLDGVRYTVRRSREALEAWQVLHLVATLQGQVLYMVNIKMSGRDSAGGFVPSAGLPGSLVQYSLFDRDWQLLAERAAYTYQTEESLLPLDVRFSRLDTMPHGLNELSLELRDTLSTVLSLSVTDAGLPVGGSGDIVSYLLVGSELRGGLSCQGSFGDTGREARERLDRAVLTHGWRRTDWGQVFSRHPPSIRYPADSAYLFFSGWARGTPEQVRSAGALFMSLQEKTKDGTPGIRQVLVLRPSDDGYFSDSGRVLFDSVSVAYRFLGNRKTARRVELEFLPGKIPGPRSFPADMRASASVGTRPVPNQLVDAYASHLRAARGLAEVVVRTKLKPVAEQLKEVYTSGLFANVNDYTILDVEGEPINATYFNVLQYLQGRVPGLIIKGANSANPSVTGRNAHFYLDEMSVDVQLLATVPMSDVAMVMILPTSFLGSDHQLGGIAVYRKKGQDTVHRSMVDQPDLEKTTVMGYTSVGRFYSPDYSVPGSVTGDDYRPTLLWQPGIRLDRLRHSQSIRFYNNSLSRSFRVVVEGIAEDGRLVHFEKVF
ncbi:MAG: hypothetical protein QM610_10285 [Chitinophagaceae bacterium]